MTTRPRDLAEHLLVLRAQLKEKEALHELFRLYNERLLYFLQSKLSGDAEDVLQEVWLTVIRKIAGLESPGAFKSWIYRIAYNHAMTRLRRLGAAPRIESLEDHEDIVDSNEDADDLEDLTEYEGPALASALSELSSAHRDVLTLRFLEELSYQETADVLGCSVGTVRSRLHYAKRALRNQFSQVSNHHH